MSQIYIVRDSAGIVQVQLIQSDGAVHQLVPSAEDLQRPDGLYDAKTMQPVTEKYDPNQPRDSYGRWTDAATRALASMPEGTYGSAKVKKWRKDHQDLYESDAEFRGAVDAITLYTQGDYGTINAVSRFYNTGEFPSPFAAGRLRDNLDGHVAYASNALANYKHFFEGQIVTGGDLQEAGQTLPPVVAGDPGHEMTFRHVDYDTVPEGQSTLGGAVQALNAAIARAPVFETPFYRGLNPVLADEMRKLKVGDNFDVTGVTSFTRDSSLARAFANGVARGQRGGGYRHPGGVLTVLAGAQAIPVNALSPWNQQEVLSSGRFVVDSVSTDQTGTLQVSVRQTNVFKRVRPMPGQGLVTAPFMTGPFLFGELTADTETRKANRKKDEDAFDKDKGAERFVERDIEGLVVEKPTKKYDPNQPRDERGRWTDAGSVAEDALTVEEHTGEQRWAVTQYTGVYYDDINSPLRRGKTEERLPEGNLSEYVEHLDAFCNNATLNRDAVAYRGIKHDSVTNLWIEKMSVGDIVIDGGYSSVAMNARGLTKAMSNLGVHKSAVMEILLPEGARLGPAYTLSQHAREQELLLPRMSRMRYLGSVTDEASLSPYEDTFGRALIVHRFEYMGSSETGELSTQ